MKIYIAQQNYVVGDFSYNSQKIIAAIKEAKKQQSDLVVFSELAVCAYPPMDFLDFDDFVQEGIDTINKIKRETQGIAVLVGGVARNEALEGKDIYNSAYFIENGEIKQIIHKSLLPTYDIFDEYRYFEPASKWNCIELKGRKIAVTICEDIWDLTTDPLYKSPPMEHLIQQHPELMINLSASPFSYTHAASRLGMLRKNVDRYGLPVVYCNTVGAQTEIIFDGGSLVLDKSGNSIQQLPQFKEAVGMIEWMGDGAIKALNYSEISFDPSPLVPPENLQPDLNIGQIHDALVFGIREYFSKMNFRKAIVALSGGIDSAVVLALAKAALGTENVHALLMPSRFSSDHSVEDAKVLCKNLSVKYDLISIQPAFESALKALSPLFKNLPFNLAEENIQARLRGLFVMAFSNKFGYIVLNTSNKSELAVGYGTLYGDMAGGLSIIGDVYKTQVYALARFINNESEIIPLNILAKAPSAELRPNQKDADSLPDYAIMDDLLFRYIECFQRKNALLKTGFSEEIIQRVLHLVNNSEYKRKQFCPILRISPKAFGPGRRMPVAAHYEG